MYNSYYQFSESPFSVTPDPQFYYSNEVYREAWATMRYGIAGRKGFMLIVGEAGTGKTTLLRKALREFPPQIKSAYVSNTLLSFVELLRLSLQDLGLPAAGSDKLELLEELNRFLLEEFAKGHVVTLLLDEAQDLSVECLEELRLLGNLETDKHKLLQIVLVGQPAIEEKLHCRELLQLAQRVALHCRLRPMETQEVGAYIESRLQTIGRKTQEFFEPGAIEKIAVSSQGIPRLINILCDNALLTAYGASKFRVTAAMAEEVASELFTGARRVEVPLIEFADPRQEQTSVPPELGPSNPSVIQVKRSTRRFLHAPRVTLPRFARAALAAVVLMMIGGLLYSRQSPRVDLDPGANIAPPPGAARNESTQYPEPKPFVSKLHSPVSSATIASAPSANANGVAPTRNNRLATAPGSQEKLVRDVPSKSPVPTVAERLKVVVAGDGSKHASSFDHFSVVGASFVRSRPASNADIVATLEPGTDISVTGKSGEYLRVRTFGRESIRGYVHREDAFFEAKKSPR